MRDGQVPELELAFFHHGWTAMLVTFLIEFVSVSLKIYSTSHNPLLAVATARKLEGNIGMLFGESLQPPQQQI